MSTWWRAQGCHSEIRSVRSQDEVQADKTSVLNGLYSELVNLCESL